MTSETDYSRQRTVAELLAEHGGAPTGRRRRRRAADEPSDSAPEAASPAPETIEPDRSVLREPVPPTFDPGPRNGSSPTTAGSDGAASRGTASNGSGADGAGASWSGSLWDPPRPGPVLTPDPAPPVPEPTSFFEKAAPFEKAPFDKAAPFENAAPSTFEKPSGVDAPMFGSTTGRPEPVEWPTEAIPLIVDPPGREVGHVGHTGPIERLQRASPRWRDALAAAERGGGLREPVGRVAPERLDDAGPPTQAAAPLELEPDLDDNELDDNELDDEYDEYDDDLAADDDRGAQRYSADAVEHPSPNRSDRQNPAGLDGLAPEEIDLEPRRRLGRFGVDSVSAGPAWALVLSQWVLGALGGAALWVGFRFLWYSLPVVALAAAVLITVGLVVLVRTLLRNDDARTTAFAVLVGLLLTVSPAILVLLDR